MDQASQVREKIDLVSFISEYIQLKKAGRNFNAVCPFHNESTPSFVVSPERQIWHCFGCGKGGDAFTFLMEYENLEFIEALRILAKKVGVTLKMKDNSMFSSQKEDTFSLNKLAAEYYNFVLTKHSAGKKALEYLKERGLNEKLVQTFNIGFSPTSGEDLSNFLINKKKFKPQSLLDAGISFNKGTKIFDFFRGRIMFPLIDHRGNIVGFSGRNMSDTDFGPKYINTRDTLVYHKGSMFFGLNQAKEEIRKVGYSVIMEGEFDVISAFKEGITNVVALKGTALTEQQAMLLSRFAPKTLLCLDQDSAGYEAVKRSIPNLEKRSLTIGVVQYDGKDPDEAIKKNSIGFKKAIKDHVEVYDYLLTKLSSEYPIKTGEGKKRITDELLPLISLIQNEIVKEHYLKKVSSAIDVSFESLLRQIEKKEEQKEEKQIVKSDSKMERRELLEEYLLAIILQSTQPKELFEKTRDVLTGYKFKTPSIGKIMQQLKEIKNFDMKAISNTLPKELLPVFDKSFLMPLPKFDDATKYEEELIKVAKDLRIIHLKDRIREISVELKSENTENEIKVLQDEIANITSQMASS